MQQVNQEDLQLRARATECIGLIAIAVGRQKFNPFLDGVMKLAIAGLKFESAELKEYTFQFFGNIAKLLQEDFSSYLNFVMEHLLDSIEEEATEIHRSTSDDDDIPSFLNEDDDDPTKHVTMQVRTSLLDEKSAAIEALGIIASMTKYINYNIYLFIL